MSKLLLIDNYDSFTYNLVHYLAELGAEVTVERNDALDVNAILAMKPDGIVISPGPGTPDDSGVCLDVLTHFKTRDVIPLLGVCLGHQSLAQAFGGRVIRGQKPMHGKVTPVLHQQEGVFAGLPSPFDATRYHSLIVDAGSLPDCLHVTARTEDNVIMGIQHNTLPLHGVQFHPESIASQHGHAILKNFMEML